MSVRNAIPEKEDNLSYNLTDLCGMDITPITPEMDLNQVSRDNLQLLVNKIFTTLPREQADTEIVAVVKNHGDLPKPAFRLPRQKPCPKPKAPTRWEKFAQEKGIQKKKRSRMVYDENVEDWVPRWGYKSIKKNEEKFNWALESKSTDNPFQKVKTEKKLDMAKQKMREMRNKVEGAGFNMKDMALDGSDGLKRGKEGLQEALRRAQVSSASSGKFDRRADNEKIVKKTGKRTKIDTAVSFSDEKSRSLKMLDKLSSGTYVDAKKSIGFAQGEKEKKNKKSKASGGGGGKGGGKKGGSRKGRGKVQK